MRKVSFAAEKRKPYQTLIQRKKGCFDSVAPRMSRRVLSEHQARKEKKQFFSFFIKIFKKTSTFLVSLIPKKKQRVLSDVILQKRSTRFGSRASKNWIPNFLGMTKSKTGRVKSKMGITKITVRKESDQKNPLFSMFMAFGSSASKNWKQAFKYGRRILRMMMGNWRAQVSALLIVIILGGVYLFPSGTQGATYTFTQTSWAGGATANTANHTSNQTGWNQYVNQTGLTVGTDVKLPTVPYTFTDDGTTIPQNIASGGGFSNGTNATTAVTGSGVGASVALSGTTVPINGWDTGVKGVPLGTGYGSHMIRNGSDDTIYVTQGDNTTNFYKYTISTNIWTTLAATPVGIGDGSSMIRNGTEDTIYVTRGVNTANFYKYTISTNIWTTLTSAPGIIGFGSTMIRNSSDDAIYVTQGSFATGFYKYTISTNTWATLATTPGVLYQGSSLVRNASEDAIYLTQGVALTGFYKYTISTNTWTTLAVTPGNISDGSNMIRNGAEDAIYVTQGNSATGFYKYTISTNIWTTLTSAPGIVGPGGNMIRNGTEDTIYVMEGVSVGSFYKYTISTNTWTTLAAALGQINYGSSMIRNGTDDTIYVTQGKSSNGFYKYTISTNTWTGSTVSNLATLPGVATNGSMMIRNGTDNDIYATLGNGSTGFYKYSISTNTWATLATIPFGVGSGSIMIRNGSDDTIYVTRGNGSNAFYKYTISTNTWTTLAVTPGGLGPGSRAILSSTEDAIYVTQGNFATGFYKYTISTNTWATLAVTPGVVGGGSAMIRNSTEDAIYVTQGNFATGFYKYTISTNTWATLAVAPGNIGDGSTMIRNGADDTVYVTRGANTTSFYKYTISTNTWATLAVAPGALYVGSSMIRNGVDDTIYVTQGNSATGFYKYSVVGNSWTTLSPTPGFLGDGSFMIQTPSEDVIYVMQGNTSAGFYKFIIQATTYNVSGTFTSAPINIGSGVPSFGNISWSSTLNGQTILLKVRSSVTVDFSGATAWVSCANITSGTALSTGGCVTNGHQYIQYQASLTTGDTTKTPTLDAVTIGYSQYGSGNFISSAYNSESFANLLSKMSWTATGTSGTETIQFQVRSAPTVGGLATATWCGYEDCSGATYFDAVENGVTLSPTHPLLAGSDDQYFQYRAFLSSGGAITPTLNSMTIQYVVNAAPNFDTTFDTNGITVSQISDSADPNWGKVRIQYKVRDVDSVDGSNTPGFITPSFAYDNGTGFTTITAPSLSAGALTNKAVGQVTYSQYEAIWDAKTDIPNTYNVGLQVRVMVNDNEAANNTAVATDTVLFDSKSTAFGTYPVLVDASLVPASVTLSATDDSSFNMKVGLATDLSTSSWEAYSATKLLSLATNPDTVYAQFRDIFGNISSIASVTSTETPSLMIIQDVSNAATSVWRLFVSWKPVASPAGGFSRYELYRSTDNITFSLLTTVTSRTTNYYIDETTAYNTLYYYKIKMIDSLGNVSWFSSVLQGKADGLQNAGEGGGGTDITPPIVTGVASSAVSTTQATITWSTDELSTSTVGFSVNAGFFVDEVGVATYMDNVSGTGVHQVVLTGLLPSTTYHYQVKSSDPSLNQTIDNNGGPGYSFTTNPGPAISNVALSSAANTQATIVWNTDINATTFVSYATALSGGALVTPTEVGTAGLVKNHSQLVNGLTTNTKYYFSVKSVDVDGNIAIDNNAGTFYTFTTTRDLVSPIISTLSASVITFDRVAITWLTDEQATSQIRYATTSGGPYTATTETVTYGQDHFVILPALTADTTYYFKAYSSDLSHNQAVSSENSFKTLKDPTYQHAPLASITSISASLVTDTNAVISLTTDQPAMCSLEYGTTPSSYTATPVTETLENKKHSITLPSLLFSTLYYYRATCIDNLNTSVVSPEGSFTTKPLQVNSGSELGDVTAPTLSSVGISVVTGENATISWKTDEVANGYVRYGITADYGNMAGDDLINASVSTYSSEHTVLLKNLVPSTKYYYAVLSSDAKGNLSASSESSFTTTSPSTISSINIVSNKIGEVILAWKTSSAMSSIVEYGLTETYGDKQESTTATKEHVVTITKLASNQLYHFRVKGKDQDNNLFASSDYTFAPRSLPTISNISSQVLSDTEVEVRFLTNVPTEASVTFANTKNNKDTGSQGKPDLALSHSIVLKGLEPGASYGGKIVASDEAGNKVTQDVQNFTLSQDSAAPVVDQLKTDMALAQDGKVQTIVSWYTDEPATTSISYKESSSGEEKNLDVKGDLSTSHVVVLTAFKMGAVYFVKVHSTDKSGNEATSKERMIVTPQQTENVVQMIISNFNDIFSWAKL